MDADRWKRISTLLDEALAREPRTRGAFLKEACGDDAALEREVLALLLRIEADAPSPLDTSVLGLVAARLADAAGTASSSGRLVEDPVLTPGHHLGPYRILEKIGEGGTSLVFRAERADEHLTREVAIKILAAHGPDQATLRERFRAERQILAALDHPNIAQIFDGGATDGGYPYLIMEYVDGLPITSRCRERRLSLEERLALFCTVCDAVQHAHQRLVVHRDIKPGNVFVRGDGTVKLLDFGIAKLLDPDTTKLGDANPRTRVGTWLLTPSYAAPEQVGREIITTATDVFSLGILLFEILTDHSPRRFEGLPPSEIIRKIETADMPRPSSSVDPGAVIETHRLRGDLDAIVARATRRDPEERYTSALELAADLRRFLRGEPVMARAASRGYLVRRWAWRHRLAIAVSGMVLAGVFGAFAFHNSQVTRERNRARVEARKAQQTADFLTEVFSLADPDEVRGDSVTARELLDRASERIDTQLADDIATRTAMTLQMVGIYSKLGLIDRARPLAERALADAERSGVPATDRIGLLAALVDIHMDAARYEAADSLLARARALVREGPGSNSPEGAGILERTARWEDERGDVAAADSLFREALAIRSAVHPEDDPRIATAHHNLGTMLDNHGRHAEAEFHLRESVRIRQAVLPHPNSEFANALRSLGTCLIHLGRHGEAEPLIRDALREQEALLGPRHPAVGSSLYSLGILLGRLGQHAEAIEVYERAREIELLGAPPHSFNVLAIDNNIANRLRELGRSDEALERYRRLIDTCVAAHGTEHVATGIYRGNYANALLDAGRVDEAVVEAEESVRIVALHYGWENDRVAAKLLALGRAMQAAGRFAEADSVYQAAHEAYSAVSGNEYRARYTVLLDRARLLLDRGQPGEAVPLLESCVDHYAAETDSINLLRAEAWLGAARARSAVAAADLSAGASQLAQARDRLRAMLSPSHRVLIEVEAIDAGQ